MLDDSLCVSFVMHRSSSLLQSACTGHGSGILTESSKLSRNLGVKVAGRTSSSEPLSRFPQHNFHWIQLEPPHSSTVCGHFHSRFELQMQHSHSKAAAKVPRFVASSGIESNLQQLGFEDEQAARIRSYLAAQRRLVNTENVRLWLHLLQKYKVQQPVDVVTRYPIILCSKAQSMVHNAESVVMWLASLALTSTQIGQLLSKRPMLLCIPYTTSAAVAAWLMSELGWNGSMISRTLIKHPQLFSLSVADNLAPKLAWFIHRNFSVPTMGRALYTTPALLDSSLERNNTQLSAMHALGLNEGEALGMVRKAPTLLNLNINGPVTQAKLRYITQVMGFQIKDICKHPRCLTYSLVERLGPRWSFHCAHSLAGQPFDLSSKLKLTDKDFVQCMASVSLDARCAALGISCFHFFQEEKARWQQREGREWGSSAAKVLLGQIS